MTSEMMDDMFDDPEVDALADEETDQVLMEVAGIKMQGRLRIDIDIIKGLESAFKSIVVDHTFEQSIVFH